MAGSGTVRRRLIPAGPDRLLPGGDEKPSLVVSGVFPLLAGAVCMGCAPGEHVAWRLSPDKIEGAAPMAKWIAAPAAFWVASPRALLRLAAAPPRPTQASTSPAGGPA